MPAYLPAELEELIDPSSTFISIRNLAEAAEAGRIALSSVTSYIKAVERGDKLKFSRTMPVPMSMKEAVDHRGYDLTPRQVVYKGYGEGRWTLAEVEAWENNETVLSEARPSKARRGIYLTRARRSPAKRSSTEGMFVPKMSLDIICSFQISDGAKACLGLLMSIAGKASVISTYTSSLARRMGKTARTVRNYFMSLEDAGLITRVPGKEQNTVVITISSDCRPEAYEEPQDVRAYKMARRSGNPALQLLALTVATNVMQAFPAEFPEASRRKEISAFNPESYLLVEKADQTQTSRAPRKATMGHTTHSTLIRTTRPVAFRRIRASQVPIDASENDHKQAWVAGPGMEKGSTGILPIVRSRTA